MIRILPVAAATLTLLPVMAGAASFTPVDDFETGAFDHSSVAAYEEHIVPVPGYQSHCVTPERTVILEPNGGTVHARLTPGQSIDDAVAITVRGSGRCRLNYDWGFPADLGFGGQVDRISMQVSGPAGVLLSCGLQDAGSATAASRVIPAGGGVQTVDWPLSLWSGSLNDPTSTTAMTFYFPPSSSDYVVHDIRFLGSGVGPVDFTGNFVATQVPPVPSFPLVFQILDLVGNPLYQADVAITQAIADSQIQPAADWNWAEGEGLGGEVAEMSFLWTEPGGVQETTLSFSIDLSADNGLIPEVYPPDPVHTAESILLAFPVLMRDVTGAVQGVSDTQMVFDFHEFQAQSLEFQEVVVTENAARTAGPGFTVSFRLAFSGSGSPDEVEPLFRATWMSGWTTQVPTGVPSGPAVAGTGDPDGPGLTARPSVARSGTELVFRDPRRTSGSVTVRDIRGRTVRRLDVAAGAASVYWNGAAGDGSPLPAGVYFVREESGESRSPAARVVLLR